MVPPVPGHAGAGNQLGQGLAPVLWENSLSRALALWMNPCKAAGLPHAPQSFQEAVLCFPSLVKACSPHVLWEDAWRRQAWEEISNKPPFRILFLCPPFTVVLALLLFLTLLPEDEFLSRVV